jgi:hypothetical protein
VMFEVLTAILCLVLIFVCERWRNAVRREKDRLREYRKVLVDALRQKSEECKKAGQHERTVGYEGAKQLVHDSWKYPCLRGDYYPEWKGG